MLLIGLLVVGAIVAVRLAISVSFDRLWISLSASGLE